MSSAQRYIDVLNNLNSQINLLYQQGRYTEAKEAANKAMALAKQAFGAKNAYTYSFKEHLRSIDEQLTKQKKAVGGQELGWPAKTGFLLLALLIIWSAGLAQPVYNDSSKAAKPVAIASKIPATGLPYYRINAVFNPANKSLTGTEDIMFNNSAGNLAVTLNLFINKYNDPSLANSEMRQYDISNGWDPGYINIQSAACNGQKVNFNQSGQYLTVNLKPELVKSGKPVSLQLSFAIKIPYITDRTGGNSHGVWLTNWLPTVALSSMHNPPTEIGDSYDNESASYNLNLTVPKGYSLVLSNTDRVQNEGSQIVYHSLLEHVRDLPLFINHDYHVSSVMDNGVKISYYYYSDALATNKVLNTARKAMDFFRSNIGPYPWQQLNLVENNMYLDGMEFSTMELISEDAVRHNLAPTVFHEVSHQWFYNIIGSDQYYAPYLDEGAAEFFTGYVLEGQPPKYTPNLYNLDQSINEYSSWDSYRQVAYVEGRELYEDLFSILGKDQFMNLMREYYNTYRYGFVTGSDFKEFVAEHIGIKALQQIY